MSEPLDTNMLRELEELMADEFPQLLGTFLAESQRQFQQASAAWAEQDLGRLRATVHSLKGSCGNIGATPLSGLCADLEHAARHRQTADVPRLLTAVQGELETVRGAIGRLVQSL